MNPVQQALTSVVEMRMDYPSKSAGPNSGWRWKSGCPDSNCRLLVPNPMERVISGAQP